VWRRAAAELVLAVVVTVGVAGVGPAAAQTQVALSPASGPPGTEFVVTGTGFAALPVEIRWGGLSGPVIAEASGPDFSVSAAVPPDAPPNSHQVVAVVTDGSAVSSSSASFQVTTGEAPAVPPPAPEESTTTTEPPPTTSTPPTAPPTGPRAVEPPAAGRGGLSGGVDGGVDGGAIGTTNGGATGAVPSAGGAATVTSTATTVAGAATPGEPTTPTVIVAPGAEPGPTPGGPQGASTVPSGPADGVTPAALGPTRNSQSAGAVSNPALLIAGLAMVFAGGVFLAVRNRQRA